VLFILIPILVCGALLAIAQYVRVTRSATTRAVGSVAMYGYGAAQLADAAAGAGGGSFGSSPRAAGGLENRLAAAARRMSAPDYEKRVRMRLLQAGMYEAQPSRFLALRASSALVMTAIGLLYASGNASPLIKLVVLVGGPALGWLLPDTMLSMRIKSRRKLIERDAADFIDLLAITVKAGLSLDQSIRVTAERLHGAMAEEARLMLNEIRVGQSRSSAMKRMAERADTPTINSFVRTMTQSDSMGVSVAQTLRGLAEDARIRKRQTAEEMAQKAPIKMIFPLAACIFPAILLVAAGPGIIGMTRALSI
jgi:tight adherence protein C